MINLDEKIAASLSEGDKALFDAQMNELGIFDALGETFKGKHRAINIFGFVLTFVVFALVLFFGYQLFSVDAVSEKIHWLGAFITAVIALASLKLWFWMEMNRVSQLRDLKRLELTVAMAIKHSSS